jgi:thiol peroxidase
LIIAVPSLDTPVCAIETKFNNQVALVDGGEVYVVLMDLPFAAKRFYSTEGIENLTVLSDFRDKSFATNYGTLIAEGVLRGLSVRVIFVIAKDGKIAYKEITQDITDEPKYEDALEAFKKEAIK